MRKKEKEKEKKFSLKDLVWFLQSTKCYVIIKLNISVALVSHPD